MSRQRSAALVPALVAAGVVAVLVVAAWSFVALRSATTSTTSVDSDRLRIDGGVVLVEGAVSAARPAHAMPGMGTDNDPVPPGKRRVSVDVTVAATGDQPLPYDLNTFRLAADGAGPARPHRGVLPGDVLPAGSRISGTLVFDVPEAATSGRLSYDGADPVVVALPAESGRSGPATPSATGGHGEHSHSDAGSPSPEDGR